MYKIRDGFCEQRSIKYIFEATQLDGASITRYSQGAKWVYLTWDAVKGLLISFCSVASTYQILIAQPEKYVAGKKLLPFSHFPLC